MICYIQNKIKNAEEKMDQKYSAPAVEKMLAVIELIAESDSGYSINELARLTQSSVNSIYRICMVMREHGYLISDPKSGHFVLGNKFYFIGKAAEKRMTLNNVAKPIMERLTLETGESTQLITMRGDRALIQAQVETSNPIRIHAETCSLILPHCSAAGKSILAFMDDSELEKVLPSHPERLTKNTINSRKELEKELKKIRCEFVAFDREEYMPGLRCVGAPIFDDEGKCVAGIDVMFPIYRVSEADEARFVPLVRKAAEDISLEMGYKYTYIHKEKN